MSSRSNPFDELERLIDRMSRQFEDAARRWGEDDWPGLGTGAGTGAGADLAVDLVEQDDAFVVTVDVPGFDRDELDLHIDDQTLWIDGERREESASESDEGSYLRHERRRESVRRSVRLPAPVEPDGVEATLRNGILTVTLPKAEPASTSRSVEIEPE